MPMSRSGPSPEEKQRREWVDRQETFKDRQEEFTRGKGTATTKEERQARSQAFAEYRQAHRAEDIATGRREPGVSIRMHQIMWARWAEVAVEQELTAREAFADIVAQSDSDAILQEFRASLVAITGAAFAIEAVYGDIKYLIPEPPPRNGRRVVLLWRALCQAFGIPASQGQRLLGNLRWLFDLRDKSAHPYTEAATPESHPAGITTSAEHSLFNAVTCGRAVDIMMEVFGYAATPPLALGRWIERWVVDRQPYHETVIGPLTARRAEVPLVVPDHADE